MKKIDWVATAWVSPSHRFKVARIHPDREA